MGKHLSVSSVMNELDLGELMDEVKALNDIVKLYEQAIDSCLTNNKVERYLAKACETQLAIVRDIASKELW